jgi:hypothetical protein
MIFILMWRTFVFMPAEPASIDVNVIAKIDGLRKLNKRKKKAYTAKEFFLKVLIPLVEEEHDKCGEWVIFQKRFANKIKYNVDEEKQIYTLITTSKDLNSFLKYITDVEWDIITKLEDARRNKTHVEQRTWDMGYHQALDIIKTLDESKLQQVYDEVRDDRAKKKVFGSLAKCFLSGKPVGGVGDHICPMRGNRWKTCCLGSNTPWNLAPVVSALNQPYKNIVVFVDGKFQKVCLDNTTFDWEYDVVPGNYLYVAEAQDKIGTTIKVKNEGNSLEILRQAFISGCQVKIQIQRDVETCEQCNKVDRKCGYCEPKPDEIDGVEAVNMYQIVNIKHDGESIIIAFDEMWASYDKIKKDAKIFLWSPWNTWSSRFADLLMGDGTDALYDKAYNYIHGQLTSDDMTYHFKTTMRQTEFEVVNQRIKLEVQETRDATIVHNIDHFNSILLKGHPFLDRSHTDQSTTGMNRQARAFVDKVLKMPSISQWYNEKNSSSKTFFEKKHRELKMLLGRSSPTLAKFKEFFTQAEGDSTLSEKRKQFWTDKNFQVEYEVYKFMFSSGAHEIYKWMKDKYSLFEDNIPVAASSSSATESKTSPVEMRKHNAIDIFMKLEIWQRYVTKRRAHMEWKLDPDKLAALEKFLVDGVKQISDKTKDYISTETIIRRGNIITIPLGGAESGT